MAAGSSSVMIQLQNRELWERFMKAGTEMVITKQGRCMFPVIRLNVSGLEPNCHYALVMDFVIAKESKRKFIHSSSSWTSAMPADFSPIEGSYVHPSTPAKGCELMDSTLSFHKLKLSNRFHVSPQVVTLKSMHVYIPRFHVYETPYGYQGEWYHVTSFILHQAEFVAVTAYNNKTVCKLKIDNNPFAKAFRKADPKSAKRQRLDLACGSGETTTPNLASGTSYTKESPSDQSACEGSLASWEGSGNDPPYCQDMYVVVPTFEPFSWEKCSEENLTLADCSGAVTQERMICLADSTRREDERQLHSETRGPELLNSAIKEKEGRNDTYSYEVQDQPDEASMEPKVVTDSAFLSENFIKPLNGVDRLEMLCSRSGSVPGAPTIKINGDWTCENQSVSVQEGSTAEKRDSAQRDCVELLAPMILSGRHRRKATPRRIRRQGFQTPTDTSASDRQITSTPESPGIFVEKPEKIHTDQQMPEIQSISKPVVAKIQEASEGEFQSIVQDNFQEIQNTSEERLQETQSVPEEQDQMIQDASSEQNKDCEEEGELCDVMWLTCLGSTTNVEDSNSNVFKVLEMATPVQLTTTTGDDNTTLHTSQVPVAMTSTASCSLAGDASKCSATRNHVMSKSPAALPVTPSNVHGTAKETETNQSAASPLGHEMSVPVESNANQVKSCAPSIMDEAPPIPFAAQDGKGLTYCSFADVLGNPAVTGLNGTCDVSELESQSSTQTWFPGHGVSTQVSEHVTQAEMPTEIRCSLPNQFSSVSSSWPVIVSVYSQQSSKAGREPHAMPLNVTSVDRTTDIPMSHEENRNSTENMADAPRWSSSVKPWPVMTALPTASEVRLSEAKENSGPVVLRSYSLQTGQQHNSNGAGIARVQMSSPSYDRDVLLSSYRRNAGVMEHSSSYKSSCFPVALEGCYSFRVSRPKEATVQRPYLFNRYYGPTRVIFSRFSLEPRCSVLPCIPVPSTRYGGKPREHSFTGLD